VKTSGGLNEINDGIGAEVKAMLVEVEEFSNIRYRIFLL
jgi:hypothetical protein